MARNKELSSETRQSILVLRNEGYSLREIAKKLKISYNAVVEQCELALTRIERRKFEKQMPHKSSTDSFIK